jgi:TRAP-type mannitol/chloroaromatic compound transport system permease small subunit
MCGPYSLALTADLRAEVLVRRMGKRVQAASDLALYVVALVPAAAAILRWIGSREAAALRAIEVVVPLAAVLVAAQVAAEIARCVVGVRTGAWPPGGPS